MTATFVLPRKAVRFWRLWLVVRGEGVFWLVFQTSFKYPQNIRYGIVITIYRYGFLNRIFRYGICIEKYRYGK